MQFYLNGFEPGDPMDHSGAGGVSTPAAKALPSEVDVLIVGCGPAGLALATQLAAFPDITTRIVEQKEGPLEIGQADGIACRTMEMFEAFGFSERVLKEAHWINETSFWKPSDDNPEYIARSGRVQDTEDGLSEFPHVVLNQARVHDFFLETMEKAPTRLVPDYGRRLVELKRSEAEAQHPVEVRLERLGPEHEGEMETVSARYVVGCDGARSSVRKSLGLELHGDSANHAWGVMDVLAVTDFPDIRIKAAIHSANGSVLIIPREGGYMVRLYIEMDKLDANERVSNRNITVDHLISAAQKILHPYTLDVKEVAWWSVYEIGQRLCPRFDDAGTDGGNGRNPRVFIAGDACHTHSPKAGQGMNVSLRDTFNLGWKLASVLRGQSRPELLQTYSRERQALAKQLIGFDREFAKMFSTRPKVGAGSGGDEGVDPAEFQKYFVQQGRFTAGTATEYAPSMITGEATYRNLAPGFVLGQRFHSAPVTRLADARPMELGHVVRADGRWRIFVFAGSEEPLEADSNVSALCRFLAGSESSPVRRYTPADADLDSVIDVRVVFQQHHQSFSVPDFPEFLWPAKGRYGLRDYEKMFCAPLRHGEDIFDRRGIDRGNGCMVIVRPDQHVAHVLPIGGYDQLAGFFDGFMQPQQG